MGHRVSKDGGVGNKGGGNRDSLGVLRDSFIGNISHVSIHIISGVADSLGPAVRESHLVRARLHAEAIRALSSCEGGARVVISNSVVEVVGGDLGKGVTCSVGSGVSNS